MDDSERESAYTLGSEKNSIELGDRTGASRKGNAWRVIMIRWSGSRGGVWAAPAGQAGHACQLALHAVVLPSLQHEPPNTGQETDWHSQRGPTVRDGGLLPPGAGLEPRLRYPRAGVFSAASSQRRVMAFLSLPQAAFPILCMFSRDLTCHSRVPGSSCWWAVVANCGVTGIRS